jgi:hypothetical protein
MTARELTTYLQDARPTGDGFTGRCPAHDDQRTSLSFQDEECGVLVKWHDGCSLDGVWKSLIERVAKRTRRGAFPLSVEMLERQQRVV